MGLRARGASGGGGFWCTALHASRGHADDTSMPGTGGISQDGGGN